MRRVRSLAMLLALSVGCSWITMTPASKSSCTDDRVVPTADAVAAVALGVVAVGAAIGIAGEDSGGVPPQVIGVVAGIPAGLGVVFAFSSYYGFTNASACRRRSAMTARR